MRQMNLAFAVAAAVLALPAIGHAQDSTKHPVKRRQQPIEIRGQVPTPQVVTVRPREVPTYSRQVLYPRFFDHDFWPSILPAYQLVPKRQVTGAVPLDSVTARADSAATGALRTTSPPTSPSATRSTPSISADSVRQQPAPAARPDSTSPPSGTPPARTSR
ncbi:MAG: hypothetical protein ACJ79K_16505 [Gemmatimonadaceae bacterium]